MNLSNIQLYAIVHDVDKFRARFLKYYKQSKEIKEDDRKKSPGKRGKSKANKDKLEETPKKDQSLEMVREKQAMYI